MSPSGQAIRDLLSRAVRQLRLRGAADVALAVAALLPAALLVAWVVGQWGLKGVGPLALWMAAGAAAVLVLVLLGRRWVRGVDPAVVAAAAERARGFPEGSLRGVVELAEGLPHGVSAALFRRSESQLAERVAGATPRELSGELGVMVRRRRSRLGGAATALVLLTVLAGFAAPDRARGAWVPLLRPLEHLRGPVLPPLVVTPGDTAVDRGAMLGVDVRAELRSRVTVHWRSVGDVPRSRVIGVEAGRGRAGIGPIGAVVSYWVAAPDGAVSDTFRATPRDPLLVTRLAVEVEYPEHVGRAADHYQGDTPLLRVPEGTRISVAGEANRRLAEAGIRGPGGAERPVRVDGSSFGLAWTPTAAANGRWDWSFRDLAGASAPAVAPLEIEVLEDAPPRVRISVPGADTLMPSSLMQPIAAEAMDDYGVTSGALVFRRVDGRGERGSPVTVPLTIGASSARASLRAVLDARDQPLVAGDAIEYHVEVRDNAPGRQRGRSATYLLRLPSMSELRARARREAGDVLDATHRLADRARDLESRTRDLSRSSASRGEPGRPGGQPGREAPPERLGFQEASEARDVAADHEDVLSGAAELRQRLEELERAIEAAGLRDPELQRRLDEIRELSAQLARPELREQVEALAQAADALDPEAVREALERLAERQEEFRERIEQTLEMMRRAAAEQELNTLAREAEEIAARQEALAEGLRQDAADPEGAERTEGAEGSEPAPAPDDPARPDDSGQPAGEPAGEPSDSAGSQPEDPSAAGSPSESGEADPQEELEERAERLGESMQTLQLQLLQMGEEESAAQTGSAQEQGKASQQSMQQSQEQAQQQQGAKAAQSGQRAAQQMAEAAAALDEARQQMAEARRRQAQEAVEQATQEALGLAQRQEGLRREMEQARRQGGAEGQSMQEMRSEQAALQQGLDQLDRNLSEAGRRSALIDRQVRQSIERAGLNMDETLSALQQGGLPVQQAERTVEALNQLAMSLLENDADMQRAQAPGGLQEALEQLAQLAQEQGSLNGRLSALAPMELPQQALTRQVRDAARQQAGVARRIGELSQMLGGREDVLGRLDQLSSEADQIARELDGGRLEPEVMARQERLFHRLLDAGRSLEREEYSDERVGQRPEVLDTPSPDALDPALLESGLRYPLPTPDQLERLPPAYRRLILDYFERLNDPAAGVSDRPAAGSDAESGR